MPVQAQPAVAVLLPVHNGERYVESAVRSIMEQTFRDIEIVIVDDASTDTTPEILARLAAEDARIRVLRPEGNLRLARALNYGLERIAAPYVARMDADDIALPTRLEVQKAYLDAHPDVALVGCGKLDMDADGTPRLRHPFAGDARAVRWKLRFNLPFTHPTFLFRRDAMHLRYDPEFDVTEDYDLLARLSATVPVASLADILLHYRVHPASVSSSKWDRQIAQTGEIALRVQREDLPPDIVDALAPFRAAYYDRQRATPQTTRDIFLGVRQMVDHDARRMPDRRSWLMRQSAQLVWIALLRGGRSKRAMLGDFLRHAPGFLTALILHKAEKEAVLPRFLHSRTGDRPAPTV